MTIPTTQISFSNFTTEVQTGFTDFCTDAGSTIAHALIPVRDAREAARLTAIGKITAVVSLIFNLLACLALNPISFLILPLNLAMVHDAFRLHKNCSEDLEANTLPNVEKRFEGMFSKQFFLWLGAQLNSLTSQ